MAYDRNTPEGEALHTLAHAASVTQHAVDMPPAKRDGHRWRQRGLTVHCDSCEFAHGFELKPQELLTGIDTNGYPVIKSITGKR